MYFNFFFFATILQGDIRLSIVVMQVVAFFHYDLTEGNDLKTNNKSPKENDNEYNTGTMEINCVLNQKETITNQKNVKFSGSYAWPAKLLASFIDPLVSNPF